ncbi:MAG: hypothetical protein AAF594_13745 [Bacteroidota bacterium]
MAFSRPLYKSRRLRYLSGGILGTLLLVTGFASAHASVREEPNVNQVVEQRECGDSTFVTPMPGHTEFFDQDGVLNVRVVTSGCCCCGGGENIGQATTGRIVRPAAAPTRRTPPTEGEVLPAREERPEVETETNAPPEVAVTQLPTTPPLAAGPGLAGVSADPVVRAERRGFPWWLSALALPLLVADIGDNPPDGTVCSDDSGVPIGPNRRRCRI